MKRRYLMMAKKKPSYHVWDGSRDYSFFSTEASTLYIDTPEKLAGLMAVSMNFAQYDNRPDLVDVHLLMIGKTVKLTKDLYFNEDYLDSNNYVVGSEKHEANGQSDNDRDLTHHNLAYTTFGDGIVRTIFLQISRFNFDGQYHKIVGLYSNLSNESANMFYLNSFNYLILVHNNHNMPVTAKNFTLEHCVMKNGYYAASGYDLGAALIKLYSEASYPINLSNISAKSCTVCGGCKKNTNILEASRQILLYSEALQSAYAPNIRNLNAQQCNAYVKDITSQSSYRSSGRVIGFRENGLFANISDFMFSTECFAAYSEGAMNQVIDSRTTPIPSHIYCFGNAGYSDNYDPPNLHTMSSKAALIAQVNTDITVNASGDLSLLDANGNFTGVCP